MPELSEDPPAATLSWIPRPIAALLTDQRVRYVLTGGGSAAVNYLIFAVTWLLTKSWVHYLVVQVFANVMTALVMYPAYRKLVFRATGPWLAGFVKFYSVFITGLLSGLVGLPLLIEVFDVPVLLAQVILTVAVPLASYQVYRLWAFRHRDRRGKLHHDLVDGALPGTKPQSGVAADVTARVAD